jgi:hypothetical protein
VDARVMARMRLLALAAVACAHAAPPVAPPPAPPTLALHAADGEIVARDLEWPLLVVGDDLVAHDRAGGHVRLIRAPRARLADPAARRVLLDARAAALRPAGDAVLALADQADARHALWLAPGAPPVDLGRADAAAWDGARHRVVIARLADPRGRVELDAVSPTAPAAPERLAAFDDPAIADVTALVVTAAGAWVACADRAPATLPRAHIWLAPDHGAPARRFTVERLIRLLDFDGQLWVSALATLYVAEGDARLVEVPRVVWDAPAIDGPVVYYFVQMSAPTSWTDRRIMGWVYAWRPPRAPVRIADDLVEPEAIALSHDSLYLLDHAGLLRRFDRVRGF